MSHLFCQCAMATPDLRYPMNLYVSNLAYSVTDEELRREFAAYGNVSSARVVLDRETSRSRGFGFVEMPNDAEAQEALRALEGANLGGRPLRVVVARPKEERPPQQRNFGGGGGGGGGGDRGGDRGDRGGDRGGDRRGGGGSGGGGKKDWNRDRGDRGNKWERGGGDFGGEY